MSRRYNNLFLGALCTSLVTLCAVNSANAVEGQTTVTGSQSNKSPAKTYSKTASPTEVRVEDSDSWRGKGVFERSRDEYTAQGTRVGGFLLKPTLTLEEMYDSNIYATETSEKNDMVTSVAPGVALESEWSNHQLKFNASGDLGFYSDNSRENYGDYSVGASGRLDILRETFILGSVSTSKLHEDRGSPDANATADKPIEYIENDANLTFLRNLHRFSFKAMGDYTNLNFENGETGAGVLVLNNDRDRDEYKGTVRIGYEIIPNYEAFIRGEVNERDYKLAVDQAGVNRDSDGYEVVAGTAINISGKTKGEVFAGYMSQDYDSPALKTTDGVQFGGDILWNATGLTSVKAGILRGIAETTTTNSSSYISTTYSLGLEHEVTYNILAGINGSYTLNDYESTAAVAREDDIIGAGAELRYLLNRNASVVGRYDYTNRDSNIAGQDYDRSQVSIGLKLAM